MKHQIPDSTIPHFSESPDNDLDLAQITRGDDWEITSLLEAARERSLRLLEGVSDDDGWLLQVHGTVLSTEMH